MNAMNQKNRTRAAHGAAALGLAAMALTACTASSGDEPGPGAPGSESPAAPTADTGFVEATDEAPARNVPEPEAPDTLTEQSENGARAALEYWWEAHRYLELTGDPGHLKEVSSSGCGSCSRTRTFWQEVYEQGAWSTGSERAPAQVTVEVSPQKTDATFAFVVDQEDYDVWTSGGHVLNQAHRDFADQHPWGAKARYTNEGRWIVYDLWMNHDERPDAPEPSDDPIPSESASPEPGESEEA